MKNTFSVLTKIIGIVCVLVMLAVMVLQFIPCWELEDGSMSIAEYVWFPYRHTQFTKDMRAYIGDDFMSAGDLSGSHCLILISGILGAIFCIISNKKAWPYLLSIVCGVCALALCLPALSYGALYILDTALYMPFMILGIASIVLGIAGFVCATIAKNQN